MIPQILLRSLLPLEWNDNSENMKNSAAVVITPGNNVVVIITLDNCASSLNLQVAVISAALPSEL